MDNYFESYVCDNFNVTCLKCDVTITPYLREGKLWGDNMEKFVKELYEPNTNMIDVGSHIGTFTLIMSKYLSNDYKIFSFEPVFYDILTKNINDNNLDNKVILFKNGLSNKQANFPSFNLDIDQETGFGAFSFKKIQNEKFKFSDNLNSSSNGINFYKLDDFQFKNVSFIKIDVEFFESEVLEGAIETIFYNKPTILIELFLITPVLSESQTCHEDFEASLVKNTTFSCFSFLSVLGYICFPIFPESGEFLFIHKSKTNLIQKASKLINE
jgi:FkbM family methyltransferase